MDNALIMFMAFSATVTMGSEVLKTLIKLYLPDVTIGLLLAVIFGLALSLSYGTGLISGMFGVDYGTAWNGIGFKLIDLVLSGLIYGSSSKAIVTLWERGTGKNNPTDVEQLIVNTTPEKGVSLTDIIKQAKILTNTDI